MKTVHVDTYAAEKKTENFTMAKRKQRKKKKKKKLGTPKQRNPYTLEARIRNGGGFHQHPKREESRNACRGKVDIPKEY